MSDQVAAGQVYPYAGRIVDGRAWNQVQLIAHVDAIQTLGAVAKNRTMYGRAEAGWGVWRKRGRAAMHTKN